MTFCIHCGRELQYGHHCPDCYPEDEDDDKRSKLEQAIQDDVVSAVNRRLESALTIPVIHCDVRGRMVGGVMLSLREYLNVMLDVAERREDA